MNLKIEAILSHCFWDKNKRTTQKSLQKVQLVGGCYQKWS